MRAIFLMFDSLNRHWLPAYGGAAVPLPNFARLAARSVTFDRSFVGSMPCMPARRDLHTGRYNFLHRAWGPLEPYDDSMPELLKKAGVHTHLVTDHQHYWEDGGATYHNRYSTYEFVRGQEGDRWKGLVNKPPLPPHVGRAEAQDEINRAETARRGRHPQEETFDLGLAFIEANAQAQNWFVQIETFDPHEPFHAPERLRRQVGADLTSPRFDWPPYRRVNESPAEVERCRLEYAALLALCDESLGRVLDLMDHHQLWDDTLLIVGTDHGFLLGEHELWAKCHTPFYHEIAHTPLFCWDPRLRQVGTRSDALVQLIDVPATLLDLFAQPLPPAMQGRPLSDAVAAGSDFRPAALFGMFGGHLNITDGRHVLMQAPIHPASDFFEYVLIPTRMTRRFNAEELRAATLSPPLPFTKSMPVLRVPATRTLPGGRAPLPRLDTWLQPVGDAPRRPGAGDEAIVHALRSHAVRLARAHDAPEEILLRYGLTGLLAPAALAVARHRPAIASRDRFRAHLQAFNASDTSPHEPHISNEAAVEFLLERAPIFECPDPILERTFAFRWWTLRKHLRPTPEGFVITEFLPTMPWGDRYNAICCPADHHFHEARWLRAPEILHAYARHWFGGGGRPNLYTFPAAHALHTHYLVTGDATTALDLLPALVANFEAWTLTHRDEGGLYWQTDVGDGGEESIGGHGYRTGINGAMYGDAVALAAFGRLTGDNALAARFDREAQALASRLRARLWDDAACFYKVAPRDLDQKPASIGVAAWLVNRDAALTAGARASASCPVPDSSLACLPLTPRPTSRPPHVPILSLPPAPGAVQWVQYDFPEPICASSIEVFWSETIPDIRLPRAWRLLHQDAAGTWHPVRRLRMYHACLERPSLVPFEPVRTRALRLELESFGPAPLHAPVREWHGYLPWYYPGLAAPEHAEAWKQLRDPEGFDAPFGPTTAERRHPRFCIEREGHPCQWNGPSWPFATSYVLGALANLLTGPAQPFVRDEDFFLLLQRYAASHRITLPDGSERPWIDENQAPFTGEWLTRAKLLARGAQPTERGQDYNHSTFCDLVISGLVGLRPRADAYVELRPLIPPQTWDYFCLEGIPYHGHVLTIYYDRTGSHYQRGAGLHLLADGVAIASRPDLGDLFAPLPTPPP